jgi:hypothetical protein
MASNPNNWLHYFIFYVIMQWYFVTLFFKSAGLSKFSTIQTTNLKVPLVFSNGYLLLGPFKLAELKPLY